MKLFFQVSVVLTDILSLDMTQIVYVSWCKLYLLSNKVEKIITHPLDELLGLSLVSPAGGSYLRDS